MHEEMREHSDLQKKYYHHIILHPDNVYFHTKQSKIGIDLFDNLFDVFFTLIFLIRDIKDVKEIESEEWNNFSIYSKILVLARK
jgi:hypothetical protein